MKRSRFLVSRSLLLQFRDRFNAADFAHGDDHLVARLHGVEYQPILYLELLGSSAGTGADRPALSLLNRDFAVGFVNLADRSRKTLLSKGARTGDEHKCCAGKNGFCILHVRLPTLQMYVIRAHQWIWFHWYAHGFVMIPGVCKFREHPTSQA